MDFVRYANFEVNLEALVRRKAKRLGVKNLQGLGKKRVFPVLDRATRKFHGDFDLWRMYLEITRKQKAYARATQVITEFLRLHPTKPQAWSLAARYAVDEHGDMSEARNYLQRGLRFCRRSKELWLLFAQLELDYLSKIFARQRILGLNTREEESQHPDNFDDPDADLIAFSNITASDAAIGLKTDANADVDAMKNLNKSPAMSGAIPVAIFDAAVINFEDADFIGQFFEMVCRFESMPCVSGIAQHTVDAAMKIYPEDPVVLDCWIRQPLVGHSFTEPAIIQSLGVAFARMRSTLDNNFSVLLVLRTMAWLSACLKQKISENLAEIFHTMQLRALSRYKESANASLDPDGNVTASVLGIVAKDLPSVLEATLQWALALWSSNKRLMELQNPGERQDLDILD